MFGFLKDKLKGALSKFTKKVEEEVEVEEKKVSKKKEKKPTKTTSPADTCVLLGINTFSVVPSDR